MCNELKCVQSSTCYISVNNKLARKSNINYAIDWVIFCKIWKLHGWSEYEKSRWWFLCPCHSHKDLQSVLRLFPWFVRILFRNVHYIQIDQSQQEAHIYIFNFSSRWVRCSPILFSSVRWDGSQYLVYLLLLWEESRSEPIFLRSSVFQWIGSWGDSQDIMVIFDQRAFASQVWKNYVTYSRQPVTWSGLYCTGNHYHYLIQLSVCSSCVRGMQPNLSKVFCDSIRGPSKCRSRGPPFWPAYLLTEVIGVAIFAAVFVRCCLKERVLFRLTLRYFGYLLWLSNLFPNFTLSSLLVSLLFRCKHETSICNGLGCALYPRKYCSKLARSSDIVFSVASVIYGSSLLPST